MILSLRKGLGTPTALPLDDAFHPDVSHWIHLVAVFYQAHARSARARRACVLRALGLLLAEGAPTVGRGKTF